MNDPHAPPPSEGAELPPLDVTGADEVKAHWCVREDLKNKHGKHEAHDHPEYHCRERQLAQARAERDAALEEKRSVERKLAVIFDESIYSDSLGVEGSSFSVCRWCGGGSGPGGSAPFKHNDRCLLDDEALDAKVRQVWEEEDGLRADLETAESSLLAARREIEALKLALSLNCELHGCGSAKCTAAEYHGDAEKMINELGALRERLKGGSE